MDLPCDISACCRAGPEEFGKHGTALSSTSGWVFRVVTQHPLPTPSLALNAQEVGAATQLALESEKDSSYTISVLPLCPRQEGK